MCFELVGLAVSAAGLFMGSKKQQQGTQVQTQGIQAQSAASQKAETAREQQMVIQSAREERDIIRKMQLARSTALSNASNQGAQFSSGFEGGKAQIVGDAAGGRNYNARTTEFGQTIFQANRDYASAQAITAIGSGQVAQGQAYSFNAQLIGKMVATAGGAATSLFNNPPSLFTDSWAQGATVSKTS